MCYVNILRKAIEIHVKEQNYLGICKSTNKKSQDCKDWF